MERFSMFVSAEPSIFPVEIFASSPSRANTLSQS
jgi:hypothetical protein